MSDAPNPYAATLTEPYAAEQSSEREVLADRSTRLIASVIDGLILLPVVIPIAFMAVAVLATAFKAESMLGEILSNVVGGVLGMGGFLLVHGYFLASNGQTVGKKLFSIKIVRDDGSKMPFGELVLKRYLVFWVLGLIPVVGGLLGLANVLAIFRTSRKCLHDNVAGTKVIKA